MAPTARGTSSASPIPTPKTKRSNSCVEAPAYNGGGTRFGVNISTTTMDFVPAVQLNEQKFGRLPVVRYWDTHGPLSDVWSFQNKLPQGTQLVVSFRYSPQSVIAGEHDSQIHGFFRNAPSGRTIFWNYYHEPEAGVAAGEFTPLQFSEAFRHVADIAARYCGKRLYPTLILMGWTVNPHSHLQWMSYYPGAKYVSVVAWDPYNSANATPKEYASPETLYHYVVSASQSVHKPWGIAETGSGLVPDDNGTGRAAWLRAVAQYAVSHKALFVTYFNSKDGVDFRLNDTPSLQAWRAEMNR